MGGPAQTTYVLCEIFFISPAKLQILRYFLVSPAGPKYDSRRKSVFRHPQRFARDSGRSSELDSVFPEVRSQGVGAKHADRSQRRQVGIVF